MFIAEILSRAATRWPEDTAAVDDSGAVTFSELRDRAFKLANALRAIGLEPGDRVLDLQSNSIAYLVSDLAISSAGMVRVALNPRLALHDLIYIATDSGARALLFGSEFESLAETVSTQAPAIEHVLGQGDAALGTPLASVLAGSGPDYPRHRPRPGDTISLNYSSGTTGRPKGCMRTARNRYMSTQDVLLSLLNRDFGPGDTYLHAGPMMHASGLLSLPAIAVGATQRIMGKFHAQEVFDLLASGEVTAAVLVPTMLDRVVSVAAQRGAAPAFSNLKAIIYAGSPMAPDRVRAARTLFRGKLLQFYGLVEAIPPLTVLDADDHRREELLGSAGRAAVGVRLEIIDDSGGRVTPGEVGEVAISGDHVMAGYWGVAGGDGKTLRDGYLRTGDMGYLNGDGYLFLVDRRGDMIITGGYNVYPREVEDVLRDSGDVADVAVVGVPHPDWGQAVTAFVVRGGDGEVTAEMLGSVCAARLAAFKKPKEIIFIDELPTTAIGKVDRKALRDSLTVL